MKRFLLNYFFFCLFLFIFFASGYVDSQDGLQYLAVARRMYYDNTFEMPIEQYPDENIHLSLMKAKDGKTYSPTGLGYSISLLPAVFLEDQLLSLSGSEPISAFPLENDWPVLLFASMTNAFWGALFVVVLYSYLREIEISHNNSLILSFSLTVGSNILVHTKHVFPHMMFVTMMLLTFYYLKKFSLTRKKYFLIWSGMSYGVVLIAYNPTYLLILPALGLYYLFLENFKFKFIDFKELIVNLVFSMLGLLPFVFLYFQFNILRFGGATHTGYGSSGIPLPTFPPTYVIIEGIWGLLLSPGKSIFLYTPILILLILFWFKLKRDILPEFVAAFTMFFVYLWNMGTLLGDVDFLVWHGDSSWGPRYMLPILPLLFLIISYIYIKLNKNQKIFVFLPLILIGFYANFLSVALPYQIRFAGLQQGVFFNNRMFNVYEYGNEIPRYSPIFKLSKTIVKRVKNIPMTYDHGIYNLRLIDGFDYPFDLGWAVWRGMRPDSYITFEKNDQKINHFALQIRNHQMNPDSSQSARINIIINDENINLKNNEITVDSEKEFIIDLSNIELQEKNIVKISSSYSSSTSAELKKDQALFLQVVRFNTIAQNIQTIDYPYVSNISKGLIDLEYYYWGNVQPDPWEIWHMHSGVYETTFDFWWLRPLHYWDLPYKLYFSLFSINCVSLLYFLYKTVKIDINETN
jgi:hypothetical protein